tara:strand:+ start:609 stop:818 length:210 start_codon:yes stop_codon:yes gene_type:complete
MIKANTSAHQLTSFSTMKGLSNGLEREKMPGNSLPAVLYSIKAPMLLSSNPELKRGGGRLPQASQKIKP